MISSYGNTTLTHFNISLNDENLPSIYMLPKLHKSLTKGMLIIEASKCSSKQLSKSTTFVFKLMFKRTECYNWQRSFLSGVKSFWAMCNNVIDTIKNLNGGNKSASTLCYNFSVLYTSISCGKLIRVFWIYIKVENN